MRDTVEGAKSRLRKETSRRPRIGLDLHVVDGIYQGSRTHCLELFSRVIEITPECDFVVFTSEPSKLLRFSYSFSLPNVQIVSIAHAPAAWRLLWQLPRLSTQERLDMLHMQYIVPPFSPCPTCVTVHDILFESHPQFFNKLFVARSRLLVRRSVHRSAEIFTVSEFSRNQISELYGIKAASIHTIFNGVNQRRFFPGQQGAPEVCRAGLTPGGYYLTVGRLEPRKNHAGLLQAWAALPTPRPNLAIAGAKHFGYREIIGLISKLGLTSDVTLLHQITDDSLPSFFRNARAFVYCSWAEGFGMPVLEAMASGIPVISSANTALSEVCGEAALLVNPADTKAIGDAISTVELQPQFRKTLVSRGLERIQQYTWTKAARIVREVYLRHFGFHPGHSSEEDRLPGTPPAVDSYV